jgi:hypothetical protein
MLMNPHALPLETGERLDESSFPIQQQHQIYRMMPAPSMMSIQSCIVPGSNFPMAPGAARRYPHHNAISHSYSQPYLNTSKSNSGTPSGSRDKLSRSLSKLTYHRKGSEDGNAKTASQVLSFHEKVTSSAHNKLPSVANRSSGQNSVENVNVIGTGVRIQVRFG